MKLLFTFLSLAFVGLACADRSSWEPRGTTALVVPPSLSLKNHALAIPRGGAVSPLDPKNVAEISTQLVMAIFSLQWLGPEKALESYGMKGPISPQHLFVAQREYATYVAALLGTYLHLVKGTSINTAIGYGTFPLIADVLRSVLNDDEKKIGISNAGQLVLVLAPLILNAYACLNNVENADMFTKIFAAYHMARGLFYFANPKGSCRAWFLKEGDEAFYGTVQWVGVSLFVYGMGLYGYAQGVDPLKLLALCWVPSVLNIIREAFFVNLPFEKTTSLYYSWIVLGLVVVGTLSLK